MMANEDRRRVTLDWLVDHPSFEIRSWRDAVIDKVGYDARHSCVESFWFPLLGPSAVLAARRIAGWLDRHPEGLNLELAEFGASLGVGTGTGRNTQINRTLCRLVDFGMARVAGDQFEVRTVWPPLPMRLRRRLPESLSDALTEWDHHARRSA